MKQTRRTYLATTGAIAAGTAGFAGCLGSSPAAETSHNCELPDRDQVGELPQPRVGPDDAAVTVEVFEDFACPGCRAFATGDLSRLKDDYADAVAFEHYDFPIPVSEWSERIANAARSVQDQYGDETFFAFSQAAYENQDDYSWQLVGDLAEEVGADPCTVLSDANNETYAPVINANVDEGRQRNAPGTPTVFVNGEMIDASYRAVEAAIDG